MSSVADREALLKAINETCSGLETKSVNTKEQYEALSKAKVNVNM